VEQFVLAAVDHESVEDEDVVVVLGNGDKVTLRGDLEAAAARNSDVRTLEVRDKLEKQKRIK